MGGRGASSGNNNNPHENFIKSFLGEDMTAGDLQGAVEAYAMRNGLTPRQEDELVNEIEKRNDEYFKSVKAVEIDTGDTVVGYRLLSNGKLANMFNDEVYDVKKDLRSIISDAKDYGYKVKAYTQKELKQYDKDKAKKREETNKTLDFEWYGRTKSGRIMKRNYGMKGH